MARRPQPPTVVARLLASTVRVAKSVVPLTYSRRRIDWQERGRCGWGWSGEVGHSRRVRRDGRRSAACPCVRAAEVVIRPVFCALRRLSVPMPMGALICGGAAKL